jgi:DNA-binding response OmpR family regulator
MSIRMLVLDDESVINFALKCYFEVHGFEVDVAAELDEALRLIGKTPYGVVIADLRLTGTNCEQGLEVIRAARAANTDAALILLTAYRSAEVDHRAIQAGADLLIQKGKRLVDVAHAVRSVLLDRYPSGDLSIAKESF